MAIALPNDNENALLGKLLINQGGTEVPVGGDSNHTILQKLLINQEGAPELGSSAFLDVGVTPGDIVQVGADGFICPLLIQAGRCWKARARVATTANIDLSSAPAAIDGITLAANDRVFVKDQTLGEDNGPYTYNGSGSAMTRTTDFNNDDDANAGLKISINEGTVNEETFWVLVTDPVIVLGTTVLTFERFDRLDVASVSSINTGTSNVEAITPLGLANSDLQASADAAIHDNVASEISAITNKATLVGPDFLLIEDSEAGNIKKHSTLTNLGDLLAGAGLTNTAGVLSVDAGADTTAIHDNVASEISAIANNASPVGGDFLITEDSAAANIKKHITLTNLGSLLAGTGLTNTTGVLSVDAGADTTAIHDNVASEISAIAVKATPVGADFVLIEDSADGNNKKHALLSSLPGTLPALSDGTFWIGNGSNVATENTMSGDGTMGQTGVMTIANNAVTLAKMQTVGANTMIANQTGSSAIMSQLTIAEDNIVGRLSGGNLTSLTTAQLKTMTGYMTDFSDDTTPTQTGNIDMNSNLLVGGSGVGEFSVTALGNIVAKAGDDAGSDGFFVLNNSGVTKFSANSLGKVQTGLVIEMGRVVAAGNTDIEFWSNGNSAVVGLIRQLSGSGTDMQFLTATGAVVALQLSGTTQDVTVPNGRLIITEDGAVGGVAVSIGGEADDGLYSPGINQIAMATNGIQAMLWDANQDVTIPNGVLNLSGSLNENEGATIAAAATTDIFNNTDGSTIHITGAIGITDFTDAPKAGIWRKLIFDSTPQITSGSGITVFGGTQTAEAGDIGYAYSDSTTAFTLFMVKADGTAVGATAEIGIAVTPETGDLTTGTSKVTFRMPHAMTLTGVRGNVNVAPTGATITVDINEGGSTILSTKLTIDATEETSETAATPPVISDSALADDAEITIDIDQIGSTIPGEGLKIWLIGTKL